MKLYQYEFTRQGRRDPYSLTVPVSVWLQARADGYIDFTEKELWAAQKTGILGMKRINIPGWDMDKLVLCGVETKVEV